MANNKTKRSSRKRKFKGNRYTSRASENNQNIGIDLNTQTASESKLLDSLKPEDVPETDEKNFIVDFGIFSDIISSLCCPVCFQSGLSIVQESLFGLAINMNLKCENCNYSKAFCTSQKIDKMHAINLAFVFGMRVIGKGHTAAKKLCSAVNVHSLSKKAFGCLEKKLHHAARDVACKAMNEAALEVRGNEDDKISQCGVSVDGTWQRRGYSSLNGCVSAISVDTGKVLDVEIMSKACRICGKQSSEGCGNHSCGKHTGSSGAMEPVGVFRIFERSTKTRQLQYVKYFGDGDSKAFDTVKDVYGPDTVTKYECIGHIQKRVGSRLRNIKSKQKGLGGRGKLTDVFINKLQNYYGIAIRANVNNLEGMQSSVIAAFFHCCSSAVQPMHGQCPVGAESWCKFQRAIANGKTFKEKSKGLPKTVINIIKPAYMKLCDQKLLEKCLHGKTQNANESFNGILWKFIPKDIFVELGTFQLGAYMAVIQFNRGFHGLIDILKHIGVDPGTVMLKGFAELDEERVRESKRHSLPGIKIARKKNRHAKKKKIAKIEDTEGISYKTGEF